MRRPIVSRSKQVHVSSSSAVVVQGLVKTYGVSRALNGVDLDVAPGELHGLLGPNGAGKTTLLRVLLGLVQHDAGVVRLLGVDRAPARGPLPEGVAGFADAPAYYPYLSASQNLALLARLDYHESSASRRRMIAEALERVGLIRHAGARVSGYSTGMRQRLAIAAALLRTPRLLLLDEPTSSLDPAGARDVRTLARELTDRGTTVILSSHDLNEVEAMCSTLTVMNQGRVVFSGDVAALRSRAGGSRYLLRTVDDEAARALATGPTAGRAFAGLRLAATPAGADGVELWADEPDMDAFVLALGRAGIAIRALEPHGRSLESLFFDLMGEAATAALAAEPAHMVTA